jgi:benzodiazapine receptor
MAVRGVPALLCAMETAKQLPGHVVPSPVNPWLALAGWLMLVAAAAVVGGIASSSAPAFYGSLEQPAWAPPSGVFGPVWTALYAMMGVSAWLVWRERGWARGRNALGLFVLQLAVNAIWSWLFFAWHRGGLAFADIVVLIVLVVATIWQFAKIRRAAAWLLAPYLAWITFAAALNWSVWQRNPGIL